MDDEMVGEWRIITFFIRDVRKENFIFHFLVIEMNTQAENTASASSSTTKVN